MIIITITKNKPKKLNAFICPFFSFKKIDFLSFRQPNAFFCSRSLK